MDDSPVWAVGDKCLSPYSGDGKLYSGKISTLKRSAAGIFATVRFDGYGEDDSEDVDVKKLKLVPEKHLDKEKLPKRDTSGGLFSPLQGGQPSNPQHGRYDSDDEEDCLLLLKTERLSGIILEDKLNKSVTPSSHNRKTAKKNCHDDDDHRNNDREIRTPRRRKPKLEILGGQAKYPEQELRSSRKLSDLSSNLEERAVKKALTSPTSDNTTQETDTTNENESDITDKFAGR
ncbi:hypothetical protein DPMN_084394 [Dreissena polymorpha]|uniref:Tudor domain-containing protein n=1 Tax=Dreissena polymorpha TaxID=45954 RepID=A0A9D3YDR0_DREPO|nr:hypothetical protein DPMN_084394 [Dreissena polymorpha]